jgi:hypothetical protein
MITSPFAAQNLLSLQQNHPDAAKTLLAFLQHQREKNTGSPFRIESDPSGNPLIVSIPNQQTLYDSQRSQKAQTALQAALQTTTQTFLLWSCGLGDIMPLLAPHLQNRKCILLEPETELFFFCLHYSDCRAWLASPNLLIFIGQQAIQKTTELLQKHPSIQSRGMEILSARTLSDTEESDFVNLHQCLKKCAPPGWLPSDNTQPIDPNHMVFAAGNAHKELLPLLCQEAHALGQSASQALRFPAVTRFLGNEAMLWETLGQPIPSTVLSFSNQVFLKGEWQRMKEAGIRRYLWCYDDPSRNEINDRFYDSYDRIFCFDTYHAERLNKESPIPVEYLAEATTFPDGVPGSPPPGLPERLAITFVGSTGLQRMNDAILHRMATRAPFYQELEKFTEAFLDASTPQPFFELLMEKAECIPVQNRNSKIILAEDIATLIVRNAYLTSIADLPLTIYGDRGWNEPRFVGDLHRRYAGKALAYLTETPWIYNRSLININLFNVQCVNAPTPRVLDTLACGGFLLTEYRPYMEELFEIGKELDVFHNRAELREKIMYYLQNPDQCIEIGLAGQHKIRQHHLYRHRLQSIRKL